MLIILTDEDGKFAKGSYSDGFALGSIRASAPYFTQAAEVVHSYPWQTFRHPFKCT
jgi:hypothetical protein